MKFVRRLRRMKKWEISLEFDYVGGEHALRELISELIQTLYNYEAKRIHLAVAERGDAE